MSNRKLKKQHWCNWNNCYCSSDVMEDGYCVQCKPRMNQKNKFDTLHEIHSNKKDKA